MLRGILIIVNGHPYYGRQAYNLAVTIKANQEIPIAVAFGGTALNHLSEKQMEIFDHIIELPADAPKNSGVKLSAYDVTPFKETLVLDADMLWLPNKNPSELFEEVKDAEFTAITEGYHDGDDKGNPFYFYWADVSEIRKVYKVDGKIFQWRSEVMYFKKTPRVAKMFKEAKKIFANPRLTSVKQYAGGVPDELAINIAAAIHGFEPHEEKWQPAFWWKLNRSIVPDFPTLYGYYLASFGSNTATQTIKKLYDRIMKAASYKKGHQHVFPLMSKRDYLPERKTM